MKIDRYKNKFQKVLINFFSSAVLNTEKRRAFRYALRYGKVRLMWHEYKRIKNNKLTSYPYYLTLTACLKNEAAYIVEWLEYYILHGVEHFYIYDNESSDNIKEVLAPYIAENIVTYTFFPGKFVQYDMYSDSLHKNRFSSKWMMVVDLDEFIVINSDKTIAEYLKENENIDQIQFGWRNFGDSNHKTQPEGLVIENYSYRSEWNYNEGKAIFQPAKAYFINNCHYANCVTCFVQLPFEEGQCNHYITKSEEEFYNKKTKRGDAIDPKNNYGDSFYSSRNTNDVQDTLIFKHINDVKKALASRKLR